MRWWQYVLLIITGSVAGALGISFVVLLTQNLSVPCTALSIPPGSQPSSTALPSPSTSYVCTSFPNGFVCVQVGTQYRDL
jgi:hypothetical protein